MGRILTCLTTEHDWRLVLVAAFVCLLASVTAISLFKRARASAGNTRATWIVVAGATAGCGIWATHFVAMLAYDPGLGSATISASRIASLLAAATVTAAGLAVAVYGPERWAPAIGGAVVGGGIACMHYTGMWALQLPGRMSWSLDLVAVSILLGMLLGMAALTVAVRRHGARWLRRRRSCSPSRSYRTISRRWARSKSCPTRRGSSRRPRFLRSHSHSRSRSSRSPFWR